MAQDLLVRHAVLIRRGHEPGAHAMRRHRLERRALEARLRRPLEQDPAHGVRAEPVRLDADRAGLGRAPVRDADLGAFALSVFERTIKSCFPCFVQATCSTRGPTSSERRSASAKPIKNRARSRVPARSAPHVSTRRLISIVVSAAGLHLPSERGSALQRLGASPAERACAPLAGDPGLVSGQQPPQPWASPISSDGRRVSGVGPRIVLTP